MRQRLPGLLGLVLAGGDGSRMGGDKAGALFDGVPLARRAADLLGRVCDEVFVSVRRGALEGLQTIEDGPISGGPIAGVLAAFSRAPSAAWLVLAADMPLVTGEMLRALAAGRGPRWDAVAFRSPAPGGAEPLCAVYEPRAGAELARRAAAGERSLGRVLPSLTVRLLEPPDPAALASVNTPEELARAVEEAGRASGRALDQRGRGVV